MGKVKSTFRGKALFPLLVLTFPTFSSGKRNTFMQMCTMMCKFNSLSQHTRIMHHQFFPVRSTPLDVLRDQTKLRVATLQRISTCGYYRLFQETEKKFQKISDTKAEHINVIKNKYRIVILVWNCGVIDLSFENKP